MPGTPWKWVDRNNLCELGPQWGTEDEDCLTGVRQYIQKACRLACQGVFTITAIERKLQAKQKVSIQLSPERHILLIWSTTGRSAYVLRRAYEQTGLWPVYQTWLTWSRLKYLCNHFLKIQTAPHVWLKRQADAKCERQVFGFFLASQDVRSWTLQRLRLCCVHIKLLYKLVDAFFYLVLQMDWLQLETKKRQALFCSLMLFQLPVCLYKGGSLMAWRVHSALLPALLSLFEPHKRKRAWRCQRRRIQLCAEERQRSLIL